MKWMASTGRVFARMSALFSIAAVGAFAASTAFAHVFPKKEEPGAGASVESPSSVRIVFSGSLEPDFSSLTVTDASGKQVNSAKAQVDANHPGVIAVALPKSLPAGRYTVHLAAVASDGHRTQGDYSFNVK
jgi:methionine-rich copper-binding protein CopC